MTAPATWVLHICPPVAGIQGVDRPARGARHGALDDSELAVALDVGQRRAPAGGAVQRRAPDLVALRVEHLDGVFVTGAGEVAPGSCGDSIGPPGQDGPDGRGRVDLLVGGGTTDQPAVVVPDAHMAAVGVVGAEGEPTRGGAARDEIVGPGAVEVARGGGREHAVGRELGPSGRGGTVPAQQCVGHLPERTPFDQRSPVAQRERRLHTAVGHRVAGRVGDDLVPHLATAGRVRVVATVDG